jgi:hypothetical protein
MVFQSFATRRLAENQDSDEIEFVVLLGAARTFILDEIEFVVLLGAARTFIRVVAHVTDNEVHGGSAPTYTHTLHNQRPYPAPARIKFTVDAPSSACPGCDKGCTRFVCIPLTGVDLRTLRHHALDHGVDPVDPANDPVMIRDGDLDGPRAHTAATTPTCTDETSGDARWL